MMISKPRRPFAGLALLRGLISGDNCLSGDFDAVPRLTQDRLTSKAGLVRERSMSIIGWMVVGLLFGFIATRIVYTEGRGIIPDIILGIAGAITGGFLFKEFAAESVTRLSLYSMLLAIIGA